MNTTMSTVLVKVREVFCFQQRLGLIRETVRVIANRCQNLKKLSLIGVREILDEDVIHVINRLGKQLTTLVLDGSKLTDVAHSYLNNCPR
jgi:hypothetical protein